MSLWGRRQICKNFVDGDGCFVQCGSHNLVWRVDFFVCPKICYTGRLSVVVQMNLSLHLIITAEPPIDIPAVRLIVGADNNTIRLIHERMVFLP